MSRKYKFRDQSQPYFVTLSVVNWIDVFTRDNYKECIIQSLRFCQENKGLIVYAWCIMTNHIHLIIGTNDQPMQNILRDFKTFTSKQLKVIIQQYYGESIKEWMMNLFKIAGTKNGNNRTWQFWQQHNHPIELWDSYMVNQKLNYLHENPVKGGFVKEPKDWVWSSAIDYYGGKGLLKVRFLY